MNMGKKKPSQWSPYGVPMEEWIIVKIFKGEWWLKNRGSCMG